MLSRKLSLIGALLFIPVLVGAVTRPGPVASPDPPDAAVDVPVDKLLSWSAGTDARRYDVYLGMTNPPPLVSSNQAALSYGTKYF